MEEFTVWNADQVAIVLVGPSMERTAEVTRISLLSSSHLRTFVPTAVEENSDLVVLGPRQNERVGADVPRSVVTRIRDLGFVPDEHPTLTEDPLSLTLEDIRVVVHLRDELSIPYCLPLGLEELIDRSIRIRTFPL